MGKRAGRHADTPAPFPPTSFSVRLSSADVASSHSSTRGDLRKARASATRCFSPPLRGMMGRGATEEGSGVDCWALPGPAEPLNPESPWSLTLPACLQPHTRTRGGQRHCAPELQAAFPDQGVVSIGELQHLLVDGCLRRTIGRGKQHERRAGQQEWKCNARGPAGRAGGRL